MAKWRNARIDKIKTINWNGVAEEKEAWVGVAGGGAEAKIFVSYEQSFGVYCEAQVMCC